MIPEPDGYNGTNALIRGNMLYADSESLEVNKDIKERPSKLTFGRALKASNRILGKQTPGGDLEFQFRSDDLPILCMAHFQKYTGTAFGGAGTLVGSSQFTFVPEKGEPNYTGSAFGTGGYTSGKGDMFTAGVLVKYFDTTENGGTNAQWFKSGIVDSMDFTLSADDDAKVKSNWKFRTVDVGTKIGSLLNPNSSLGSYSSLSSFQWYSATLSVGGGTLDVTKLQFSSKNNLEPYEVLGTTNPSKYRWGRYMCDGSFDLDMPYDALKYWGTMMGGSSFAITATLYNGTSDWVTFSMPNCRLKDVKADMRGGDQETTFSLPFQAYEAETGSTSPITVVVHTLTYGSTPVTRV